MSRFICAILVLGACSEREYNISAAPERPVGELAIRGQVCDQARQVWLQDALVYTHLFDENGIIFDTRSSITDVEGRYELTGLAGGYPYDIYVQKGQEILEQFTVDLPEGGDADLAPPACFGDTDLQVVVVSGAYDDMGVVFDALGVEGYRLVDGQQGDAIVDFLSDPANLEDVDVLFFDGGHKEEGVFWGDGPNVANVQATVRTFVEGGGIVYATDWAYDVVEQVWPEAIDFVGDDTVPDAAQTGEPIELNADILDPNLQGALGIPFVPLVYDISEWPVITGVASGTQVYLAGDVSYRIGFDAIPIEDAPLLVEFGAGNGKVVVSTFRSSANSSGEALAVLGALIGSFD